MMYLIRSHVTNTDHNLDLFLEEVPDCPYPHLRHLLLPYNWHRRPNIRKATIYPTKEAAREAINRLGLSDRKEVVLTTEA